MKIIWFWVLFFTILVRPFSAYGQSLPAAKPDNVSRAISGALQGALQTRGFAANDPRFANTLARISPQITGVAGTAAAVTVAGVTAPGWASVALAIGIGAVVTYAVNLGLDALTRWLFRTDGKIDESGDSLQVQTSTAMTLGGAYWKVSFHSASVNIELAGGDGEALARQGYSEYLSQTNQNTQTSANCSVSANTVSCGIIFANKQATGAPASCPAGSMYKGGACGAYSFVSPPAVATKTGVTPQTATTDIAPADLNKPLNPAIIAAIANRAWQQAASQPGYDGLPYPQSNPVTASEAQAWTAQNPTLAPTVQDFTAPNPVSTSQPSPWALPQNPTATTTTPATTPNTNTTNPASANPLQNLGPDPGTGAPTLEQIPTALQIIQPLLNLFPDLKNYNPSMSVGACPRPTLNLFGHTQTVEAHCTILENNRAAIHAAMVLAFSLLALLIVLSA
ncbi:virulence factor TspB C-terminal domain-related protein [soil metagenome]